MLLNIDGERCKTAHCYIVFLSNSFVDYTSTLVWNYMPVIPAFARWRPENEKFKVVLSRLASVRSAWVGYMRFRLKRKFQLRNLALVILQDGGAF